MQIDSTEIVDTFAEAFKMWGTRVIVTADSPTWATAAARSAIGFATSVIGCKCEAGIEKKLAAEHTPDGRPGMSVLFFGMSAESVGKRLVERIGQCVMTCPSTACFNGLEEGESVLVGGSLRYFGDGYQCSALLNGRRLWRVPVMAGEFLVDDCFKVQPAVGGGNLLLLGETLAQTLAAAESAAEAMRAVDGVILPFPNGVVGSGSKPGSRYKSLPASTNHEYCPTLRGRIETSKVPDGVHCVLEIVIDGLDLPAVEEATRAGLYAAAKAGVKQISAGNYGGHLGQYRIGLHALLRGS